MAAGLAGRIGRLESAIGTDDEPRRVIVWHSPNIAESWIERHREILNFYVKTPDDDASPPSGPGASRRVEPQPHRAVESAEAMTAAGWGGGTGRRA